MRIYIHHYYTLYDDFEIFHNNPDTHTQSKKSLEMQQKKCPSP